MTPRPDDTHDPGLESWVPSAQAPATDFPIQNLPHGIFRRRGTGERPRGGIAIGDQILDLAELARRGLFHGAAGRAAEAATATTLNGLLALGRSHWTALRQALSALLREGSEQHRKDPAALAGLLVPQADAEMLLPVAIGDYTDFYASLHHATNVGSMFRPDNPLLPNWKHMPIGYHGRASSVVVSGTPIARPSGQTMADGAESPVYGPTRLLDYELEVGFYVGPGNALGDPVPIGSAGEHVFGFCLVNDWSARDIQKWEYQPLGPFLGKSFATSVSPWIVTADALEPFRIPASPRPAGDPAALPYLHDAGDAARGGVDLTLEVLLLTAGMRAAGHAPHRVSRGSYREMYWTPAQMLAHHSSNGCNLRPGDLLASGTVSGPEPDARGCLLELTWRGRDPIRLPGGESRTFLQEGDEVILRGVCAREGVRGIGFGECRGTVAGP